MQKKRIGQNRNRVLYAQADGGSADFLAVCQACGILVVFEYDIKRRKAEAHESAPKNRESYYQGTPSSRQGTRVSDSVRMLFLPKVFQEARECYPF